MKIFETEHKRKSAIITAVILMLLIVGVFNFGMKYLDPPIEYGLAINFGNSEVGSGEPVEKTISQSAPEKLQEEVVEEPVKETPQETVQEEVITSETAKEVPVIEKSTKKRK
ncbi:hypothetical protein RRF68_11690 [Tenacibaculum sp. HL-MS23]|uniref:hypothetical protein n=1 Tax=Tenacibaculum sp. HL-MS23 TaxID=3077734 RepID=UPI0028FC28CB|nr:hypothetical protein [Tenacibaculum sp. HL-MS23]WNW01627.1 hypothetical protein RRF68_11690 [Tenacibaculum sp. HL-MS23]